MADIKVSKDDLCAIIVYGIVPEFMPHIAFRREKHYKTAGKKVIKCPQNLFTIYPEFDRQGIII